MNEGNRETGTEQSFWANTDVDPTLTARRRRPMVSGAKFGLAVLYPWLAFMVLMLILVNMSEIMKWRAVEHLLRSIPDQIIGALIFGGPVLLGIASLVTSIQKGRPYIGVLAAILTPIGFLIALAVENRSPLKASERRAAAGSVRPA
jgi:hypothetical protein